MLNKGFGARAVILLAFPIILTVSAHAQSGSFRPEGAIQQFAEASGKTDSQEEQGLADAESLDAQRERGENLITGWKTRPNKAEGLKLLEAAIEKGDRKSLIVLGRLYADGDFLKRNRRRALELFSRAAQMRDFEGIEELGESLMWEGKSMLETREAERLLTMAGIGGRGSAWTTLAYGAVYGKLTKAGSAKYQTYVQRARALGDPEIELVEAERLLYRSGTKRNAGKAIAGLEKVAVNGNPAAIKYLIRLFRDGNGYNINRNLAKARAYLRKYGPKLSNEAQQQQALLLRAAAAWTATDFARMSRTARARDDFSTTDFQKQMFQANSNFSIYLAQETLKGKRLYKGPLNGRATKRTVTALRGVCKTLVWKGNCNKKLLSEQSLPLIILN